MRELVLVCGGDGTVAACAGALAGTGVAMALVPAGTGNLLARNLGIPLEAADGARRRLRPGRARSSTCSTSAEQRFVVMAGLGFDAALIRDTDEQLKDRIGWLAYVGGMAKALRRTPRARFSVSSTTGRAESRQAIGVLVGNVGQLQAGITLLPDARPDDGQLDVIVLAPRTVRDWPALVWRILRRRPDSGRQADIRRGKRCGSRPPVEVPVEFDGDFRGAATELRVEVLPAALVLRCGQS